MRTLEYFTRNNVDEAPVEFLHLRISEMTLHRFPGMAFGHEQRFREAEGHCEEARPDHGLAMARKGNKGNEPGGKEGARPDQPLISA